MFQKCCQSSFLSIANKFRLVNRLMSSRAELYPSVRSAMLPKDAFAGRIAFITGGGTGLGKGVATMLAQLGAKVCIASRREDVLKKAAVDIVKAANVKDANHIYPVAVDIRDASSVKAGLDACEEHLGGCPDLIVNNAAGNFICPFDRLSPGGFQAIVNIVLNGTATVTLDAGKRLIAKKKRGAFLAVSTIYAQSGSGFVVASAAAKAGVENMTKSLSAEWSRYGLRFNCIAPGPIYTEGAFGRLDPGGTLSELAKERNPTGRFGDVEEFANLACYLLSDYASWITGAIVNFDGGELPMLGGEFNHLNQIDNETWDKIQATVRSFDKKSKSKL